ncbi:MAG TPA: translocation/assembly module TamB domain-containing protein [Fimbriimonadaceae bacterium]|nr:translocation/assembly module TamB domain-containing protein [Fimbriimonadaceae bacterium]
MRRRLGSLWRGGIASIGVITICLPIGLLVLSAAYAYQCYDRLKAPGVPVELVYEAQDGPVRLTAESYAFDDRERVLVLRRARVWSSQEEAVLALDRLVLRQDGETWVGDAAGLRGIVERMPNGSYSFERYLPKKTTEGGDTAFRIAVRDVDFLYKDSLRSPTLPLRARSRLLRLEGVGENVVAGGTLEIPTVGVLPLKVTIVGSDAIQVATTVTGLELAPLVPHLRRWIDPATLRDYEPLDVAQLAVSGPIRAQIQAGRVNLAASLTARGRGIRVSDVVAGATVDGRVRWAGDRLSVAATVSEARRRLTFDGTLSWIGDFGLVGKVTASADTERAFWAPLAKVLPRELTASRPTFEGTVAWRGDRYAIDGLLQAPRMAWDGEAATDSRWKLAVDTNGLRAESVAARWSGEPVSGALALDWASGKLSAWASTGSIDLSKFLSRFGVDGIEGRGELRAVVDGTTAKPVIVVDARGQAGYRHGQTRRFLGLFEGRAEIARNMATIGRFALTGSTGMLLASGTVDLRSKEIDGVVSAGGVDVAALWDGSKGAAFLQAELGGTLSNPTATGAAEVYGFVREDIEIPYVSADVRASREEVRLDDVIVAIGAAKAEGAVSWEPKSGAIAGTWKAEGIDLQEWNERLGFDVEGFATIENGSLAGTLEDPVVGGFLAGSRVEAFGVEATGVRAEFGFTGEKWTLSRGRLEFGSNEAVTISGQYDPASRQGTFEGSLVSVPLARIPSDTSSLRFGGSANGTFAFDIRDGRFAQLGSNLEVDALEVNESPLGRGQVKVALHESTWTGSAEIGRPGRYVSVENAVYNPDTRTIDAKTLAYNFPIETLLDALPTLRDPAWEEWRRGSRGQLGAEAAVTGSIDDPDVVLSSFALSGLVVKGRDAGEITAKAVRQGGVWTIDDFLWNEQADRPDPGRLTAKGTIDEDGSLVLEGDLYNFYLDWLNVAFPKAPPIGGKIGEWTFAFGGETRKPDLVQSSLEIKNLNLGGDQALPDSLETSVTVQELTLIDGVVRAQGKFKIADLDGDLSAMVPLSAFEPSTGGTDTRRPLDVDLRVVSRALSDLDETIAGLDPTRTRGRISGSLKVSGTHDNVVATGSVESTDGVLAFEGLDTSLLAPKVRLDWDRGRLRAAASIGSSSGGFILMNTGFDFRNVAEPGLDLRQRLEQCLLNGVLVFSGFRFDQGATVASRRSQGALSGTLNVRGTLRQPRISGVAGTPVSVLGMNVLVPTEFAEGAGTSDPLFNPRFDNVMFRIKDTARLRTTTANLTTTGDATINGTLDSPRVNAALSVDEGVFRLPTARIELEEGGKIDFSYTQNALGESTAILDVNLEGRTRVTARRFGDSIETYDVTLGMRGNLLEEGGLVLTATSDPPDLSQDQIVSLLGQKDFIESLAQSSLRPGLGQARDAVLGFVLPNVITPFTENLASGLNLDYLSLSYNPLDQTTITAAKTFARGLTLFARRQLNPPPGQSPKYEVRLVYRPPFRGWVFGRSRFGIGFDQDRPWKVTFEYGVRF